MKTRESIVTSDEVILLTGATGFIGSRVLRALRDLEFRRLRCVVRPSSDLKKARKIAGIGDGDSGVEFIEGNLLSPKDCEAITRNVAVIYHLAAGTGTKSFADAFLNSVVPTRNLMEAALRHGSLRRFVNISSFSVYSNKDHKVSNVLDETSPMEERPYLRDAYCYAKAKQDELVMEYGKTRGIPYVLVRPGVVYGPGKNRIHGRVGLGTFGIFLHLGGSNRIPLTHVENCAEAIALAGLKPGINGESFNIVDDDLPSSRQFLRMYKKAVGSFHSVYVPHFASYLLCLLWEKYSSWSEGQLPPVHNRKEWIAYWKRTRYVNAKSKRLLGWDPKVKTSDGLREFFESCRVSKQHA